MENIPMKNISLIDIIKKCSNGKKTDEEMFKDFSLVNRENIHEVFKYKKFNYDFTDYITIYRDEENDDILGIIRPCYREFLTSILKFLNVRGKQEDNEETTKLLMERIDKLSSITRETDLKNEFKELFDDLLDGRDYMKIVRNNIKDKDKQKELKDYFYSCAMKESLSGYVKTQSEQLKRYVTDRYKYGLKTLETNYNEYIKEYFDIDKLAMYIADEYLTICEETDNLDIINKYFPTLEKYEKSDYNKHLYLKKNDKEEINQYYFELRMIRLKYKIRKLKNINVNWNITKVPKKTKARKVGNPQVTLFDSKQLKRIKEIGNEKDKFYSENKPLLIVTGLKGLQGYIAYVYPNGEVILDKEPNYPKNAAMYNFKIVDFDELTKLDTNKLKNKSKWISHSKGWQNRIEEIINRKATEQDKEDINEFIKTHK